MTAMNAGRRARREARRKLKAQTEKHGTMYARIAAAIEMLSIVVDGQDLPIEHEKHLSLYGHPKSIRYLAICFTPELSKGEIEFLPPQGPGPHYKWRGIPIFEKRDEAEDRIVLRWLGDPVFDFMIDGPTKLSKYQPMDGHAEARRGCALEALISMGLEP